MDLLQPMKPIDSNNFLQITLSKDDGMSWVAMSAGYQVCWTLLNYGWCHWLACPDDRTQCRIQRPDLLRSGMKILAYLSSSFIPQGWKQPKIELSGRYRLQREASAWTPRALILEPQVGCAVGVAVATEGSVPKQLPNHERISLRSMELDTIRYY
jgi:hypothetical protein